MNGAQGGYQQPYRAGAGGAQYQQQQAQQQQPPQPQRTSSSGPGPAQGQILPIASERLPADYVYFERTPATVFSKDAIARATAAKMKLELFYKVAVEGAIERNKRYVAISQLHVDWRLVIEPPSSSIHSVAGVCASTSCNGIRPSILWPPCNDDLLG